MNDVLFYYDRSSTILVMHEYIYLSINRILSCILKTIYIDKHIQVFVHIYIHALEKVPGMGY